MQRKYLVILFLSTLFSVQSIFSENAQHKPLHFFSGLWGNVGDTLSGWNWAYYGSAAVGTIYLVNSDLDERINSYYQRDNPWSRETQMAFLNWGNFIQAVPHSAIFIYGYFGDDNKLAAAGAAGLQAMGISGAMVLSLKWVSGRPRPVYNNFTNSTPRDKEFNFNILQQSWDSDRWRWPSGHTSSSFTAAAAFAGFYHDNIYVALIAYPLATLMGYAMIVGQFHWASDVFAGALIGQAVGYTVGRNFRRMYEARQNPGAEQALSTGSSSKLDYSFSPYSSPEGAQGLAVTLTF